MQAADDADQVLFHKVHKGKKLIENMLSEHKAISWLDCALHCQRYVDGFCAGFNYKSTMNGNEVNCQLTVAQQQRDGVIEAKTKNDWAFYQRQYIKEPCSPSPCADERHGKCVVNSDGTAVSCKCFEKYEGNRCEIRIFDDPNFNFALNKPTSQKTYPNVGWKAVDGNSNPAWSSGSCTQTQPLITDPQWWRVDLGEEIPVSRVVITNRNVAGARLGNFAIKIGNSLDNDGLSNPTCAGDNLSVPTGQTKTFVCTPWIRGQYLVVQSHVNDLLTLCEVEVYAYTMKMIV
ncbi:partial [Paramuricea clavata]|uniref:Partial n=1 Tax=Paramuricea clavata TaxID=317549 RepID=A0A7D9KZ20_PARCT|nr:partial [Paramuricea clavata]